MREQVRGVIRNLLFLTPPNRGSSIGRSGVKAKKMGEAAIASDVRNVFMGTHPSRSEVSSLGEMSKIMKSKKRGTSIRIKRAVNQTKASRSQITRLIKQKQSRVGYFASAWGTAAQSIGSVRVPAWIARHSAPGRSSIQEKPNGISASITNAVEWADQVYGMRSRINAALSIQARKMNNKTNKHLKDLASKFK